MRTNNNECETDVTDHPYPPLMYVLVETIFPEIWHDARLFEECLENNNPSPRYPSSGSYKFTSIECLQMSGQQPKPPVETEVIDKTKPTEQVEAWTAAANTGKAEAAQDSKIGKQDAPRIMMSINDTLPIRTIKKMAACTDQLITEKTMPGISGLFLFGKSGLSEEAVDAMQVFGECLNNEVYHNTTGENEIEK